jgi:hypothetical protein
MSNGGSGSKSPIHSILTERQLSVWSDARLGSINRQLLAELGGRAGSRNRPAPPQGRESYIPADRRHAGHTPLVVLVTAHNAREDLRTNHPRLCPRRSAYGRPLSARTELRERRLERTARPVHAAFGQPAGEFMHSPELESRAAHRYSGSRRGHRASTGSHSRGCPRSGDHRTEGVPDPFS